MAYCEYPRDFMPFDVTPVENLFLMEHMPNAPGDYVRVYLYGLMLCRYPLKDASAETVAKALSLKPEEVTEAFRYWERQGLVMRMSDKPPRYQYVSPHRAMLSGGDPQEGAYQYREYFKTLQSLFGSDRLLSPQEQAKAVDWLETLKLPEDVALLMVRSQLEKAREAGRSLRYIFRDLDALALRWASEDVRTKESAEEWLLRDGAAAKAARLVLKHMGQRRQPTLEEIRMAAKWIGEWTLSQDDIANACAEFTKASSPSFSYVDAVLKNRRAGGAPDRRNEVRSVITALGGSGAPTPAQTDIYERLLSQGFAHDAILYAASQCSKRDKHSFEDLERRLDAWRREGIVTKDAAEEYARRREPSEKAMAQAYELWGRNARPSKQEVTVMEGWLKAFPADVVRFAAERSVGSLKPFLFMQKILGTWREKGVTDLESAKREAAEFDKNAPSDAKRTAKVNPARQYEQRKYDDEAMKALAIDVSELPGDDDE